jgi:16S rRNA (uracil1498-N3)-methyltransferase
MMKPSQRLYVATALDQERPVALDAGQAHYLAHVLRLPVGAAVLLFNGRDGEWLAHLTQVGKKGAEAVCVEQTRAQTPVCDLDLLFAPVKGDRIDTIVRYRVATGDTLEAIARAHGVQPRALMSANGLGASSRLIVGQRLVVPNRQVMSEIAALA